MKEGTSTDPGWMASVAGVSLGLAGAAHVLLAGQFVLLFWWLRGLAWWATLAMGALGVAAIWAGSDLLGGRSRSAIAGTVLAPVLALLSLGLTAWCVTHLSFAIYMVIAPPVALFAAVAAPFAIGPCRRAERAVAEIRARHGGSGIFGSLD
jgi:hypothetical protein